jgi:hypothetical protein
MPYVGAVAGSAINTAMNHGDLGDFAIGLGVGIASGFAGGYGAGGIASQLGMNAAGIETALLRGALSGAIGGAATAAIYGQNIGKGALYGALGGMAVSSIVWAYRHYTTEQFIKNNVNAEKLSPEQRTAVLQAVREAGQSPVGQRLMSGFQSSGAILEFLSEPPGPGVLTGTNTAYFSGNFQANHGTAVAGETWGPSMNDAAVLIHELGHCASGFNITDRANEPLNVSQSENLYRGWMGLPFRQNYYIGGHPDVPGRSVLDILLRTW